MLQELVTPLLIGITNVVIDGVVEFWEITTLNKIFSAQYTKYERIHLISITLWKYTTLNVNSNTKYQLQ